MSVDSRDPSDGRGAAQAPKAPNVNSPPPPVPPPPLQLLEDALAAGTALYGASPIVALGSDTSAAIKRLSAKLGAIFEAVPGVRVGDRGVSHVTGGSAFVYLDVGESRYLVGCRRRNGGRLSPDIPVDIITGICLFGSESILGRAGEHVYSLTDPSTIESGISSPIEAVHLDERLHVYEAETIARLCSFIADLSDQLRSTGVRVHVHIPVIEYELYGLSLYASGYLTAELCARYREAVRRRGLLFTGLLQTSLQRPGIAVVVTSPLSWVDDTDVLSVEPSQLVRLLYERALLQDQLWHDLAIGAGHQSFQRLSLASYVYHYLATVREAQRRHGKLLVVENPEEAPIYRHALIACDQTGTSLDGTLGF